DLGGAAIAADHLAVELEHGAGDRSSIGRAVDLARRAPAQLHARLHGICDRPDWRLRTAEPHPGPGAHDAKMTDFTWVVADLALLDELRECRGNAADQHQLQSIGWRRIEPIESREPAGAGLVFDDDGGFELLAQIGRQHARIGVVAAADPEAD